MSDLKRAQELGRLLVEAQRRVEEIEEALKSAKALAFKLEREDLPELMKEIGLTEFKLASGEKIAIKEDCDAKITEANKPKAFAWLIKNHFGGIIKTEVAVAFGKGERKEALATAQSIAKEHPDHPVDVCETVHPSTLKAFVKEELAKGTKLPMDLLGIFPYSKAVVTK